jgi:hypothetical protein
MYRSWENAGSRQWFKARLMEAEGVERAATRLARAVWAAGHEVWLARDEEEDYHLAVLVSDPRPAGELEGLMRKAGLSGYFESIPRPFRLSKRVTPWPAPGGQPVGGCCWRRL